MSVVNVIEQSGSGHEFDPTLLEIGSGDVVGVNLAIARDSFRRVMGNPTLADNSEALSATAAEYLNAMQTFYFESDLVRRCQVINQAAETIMTELVLSVPGYSRSFDGVNTIGQIFQNFLHDETAESFRDSYTSPAPRAFSMTMLTMMFRERP